MLDALRVALTSLSLPHAAAALAPLVIFVFGMMVYSVFVFAVYKIISKKDILRLVVSPEEPLEKIGYFLEYIFLFPFIAFFWFFAVSIMISVMSPDISIDNIFLLAMGTISAIRALTFYSEELASDLAKIVPFGMLAVFLVRKSVSFSVVTVQTPVSVLGQIFPHAETLVYYFIFLMIIEFTLKLLGHIGAAQAEDEKAYET